LEGIQIGELGMGRAFSDFQMWIRELGRRGVILAICSKNEENAAKEPFEKHNEMVLRLEDIAVFVANWEDKAANIWRIQQILNIDMDSIVFLDDNPFERNAVASLIPEITVPDLPDDPAQYVPYLQSLNLFETASHTGGAENRARQYQAEARRVEAQKLFGSYDDYLKDLKMQAGARPFDEYHYPRIAQLTQRSNQFNLRTVRYNEADVRRLAKDGRYITLYFTLKDKISDYGLTGVVVMEKQDEETLFIDTWLMSCRVLKRGMEEFMINKIVETAAENGYRTVVGEYIKTPKNAMVAHIYEKLGFRNAGGGRFAAAVDSFVPNEAFIEENKHDKR
jgi:FkbH-like protein